MAHYDDMLKGFAETHNCVIDSTFGERPMIELRTELPFGYTDPFYADIMASMGVEVPTVWNHQAEALEAISSGLNAILSTGTASGKSLIFQLASIRKIKESGGQGRVLVLYPTKALNGDQTISWERMVRIAGMPAEWLSVIDGSVPTEERLERLGRARVLLMTPDTVHAWLMARLDHPLVRDFIANLCLTVLDEVHLYDGAFGTNVSYLLRRLRFAQMELNPAFRPEDHDQVVMATATLRNPVRFARNLLGANAWVIDETQNTAPRHAREFTVIRTRDRHRRNVMRSLLTMLGNVPADGTILAFMDSRKAVDDMAMDVNAALKVDRFAAYRSGLAPEDRVAIENELRTGKVLGVVSTSALEAGIDISGIRTVVLEGVPANSASFRQRVGRLRVGGRVIVIEDDTALKRFGSVQEHLASPPAQPIFYPANRKLQAEQALSFLHEVESIGGVGDLSGGGNLWPAGFVDAVLSYRDKTINELSAIQKAALPPPSVKPHLFHGLRTLDGPTRRLMVYDPGLQKSRLVGEVTQSQALVEALPGMVVYSRRRRYRIKEWGEAQNGVIRVRSLTGDEYSDNVRTRALVKTKCRTYLNEMKVMRGGMRFAPTVAGAPPTLDFMAECKVTIDRWAYGFAERSGKDFVRYFFGRGDAAPERLRGRTRTYAVDGRFDPRVRFETTGTVIRIGDGSISDHGLRRLGAHMVRALCAVAVVSPNDVGFIVNNLAVGVNATLTVEDRSILVYDKTPGSLLFSNRVYHHLDRVIYKMIEMIEPGDEDLNGIVTAFMGWQGRLKPAKVPTYDEWLVRGLGKGRTAAQVDAYLPGSELSWVRDGIKHWVRVTGAEVAHGTFGYTIQKVGKEFTPFPTKGGAPRVTVVRPEERHIRRFAKPDELERVPGRPTYRLGLYDLDAKAYVDAPPRETSNPDRPVAPLAGKPMTKRVGVAPAKPPRALG